MADHDYPSTSGSSFNWRLRSLEKRVDNLEAVKPELLAERVHNHGRDMEELRQEIISLKRALYTFALTVAGSSIAFAFVVLQVFQ